MSADAVMMLGGFCLGSGVVMAVSGASLRIMGLCIVGGMMIFIGLAGSYVAFTHPDFPIDFCN